MPSVSALVLRALLHHDDSTAAAEVARTIALYRVKRISHLTLRRKIRAYVFFIKHNMELLALARQTTEAWALAHNEHLKLKNRQLARTPAEACVVCLSFVRTVVCQCGHKRVCEGCVCPVCK